MKDSASAVVKYDLFMRVLDFLMVKRWRNHLWSLVKGPQVLEAGVGTGLNISCYKPQYYVTALDSNKSFLEKARYRAREKPVQVKFILGDVQNLLLADESFDTTVTTFLFCQLDNPLQGLQELYRVLRPGGQLLLLEHVRSHGLIGNLLAAFSEPLYRLTGDHIARDIEILAAAAGFTNVISKPLFTNAIKLIQAQKG